MTTRELVTLISQQPALALAVAAAPPLFAGLVSLMHGRGAGTRPPWKYAYAGLVYAACVPGLFAAVLTGYTVLFTDESLLDLSLLVYVVPIAAMILTLAIIARTVSFDDVPGFDRLSGLMLVLVTTFVALFGLSKTRIWIVFGGSLWGLALLAGALFLVLKVGGEMLLGGDGRDAAERPTTARRRS